MLFCCKCCCCFCRRSAKKRKAFPFISLRNARIHLRPCAPPSHSGFRHPYYYNLIRFSSSSSKVCHGNGPREKDGTAGIDILSKAAINVPLPSNGSLKRPCGTVAGCKRQAPTIWRTRVLGRRIWSLICLVRYLRKKNHVANVYVFNVFIILVFCICMVC